eukprot:754533-Hanusia_phi.AAC.1
MSAFLVGGKKFKAHARWTSCLAHLAVKGDGADRRAANVRSSDSASERKHERELVVIRCALERPAGAAGNDDQTHPSEGGEMEEELDEKPEDGGQMELEEEHEEDASTSLERDTKDSSETAAVKKTSKSPEKAAKKSRPAKRKDVPQAASNQDKKPKLEMMVIWLVPIMSRANVVYRVEMDYWNSVMEIVLWSFE